MYGAVYAAVHLRWVPWSDEDRDMVFRFEITVTRRQHEHITSNVDSRGGSSGGNGLPLQAAGQGHLGTCVVRWVQRYYRHHRSALLRGWERVGRWWGTVHAGLGRWLAGAYRGANVHNRRS